MFELHKSYKKLSKKQLLEELRKEKEQNCKIVWENWTLNKSNNELEKTLRSAENALNYKDKIIEKYKSLLSISVEDL